MRALFVTNLLKTPFYSLWAKAMERSGVEVFWLSTSHRWTEYLRSEGWDSQRILNVSLLGKHWKSAFVPSAEEASRLKKIDETAEIGLKNAVIMDRELSFNRSWNTEAYAQITALAIERFVVEHDIRFAFGEDTWAPEIITSAVMHANGRHFHAPHTIRIPSDRIAFFRGVFQKRIETITAEVSEEHRAIARQALQNLRERGERPYYFSLNMNQNRLRRWWFDEAWQAIVRPSAAQFDHTQPPLQMRAARRLRSIMRSARVMQSGVFESEPPTNDRPFALFLLQKQPESSVDVIGAPYTSQHEVIRALTRLLPVHWEIWVKEHPNAVGDRSLAEYRDFQRLPGLRLIEPFADTHRLIPRAALTISISGTACLEAGLLGRPAITIAEMFFGKILLRNGFDPFAASHTEFGEIANEARVMTSRQDHSRSEDFLAWSVAQSFPGVISDPSNLPSTCAPENVERVAGATVDFMRRLAR